MNDRAFVDIHVIQSFPPNCMNRDDTGSPKSCTYGGVRRARVSSQCWKHAVREYFRKSFDESELAVRTSGIPQILSDRIREIAGTIAPDVSMKMALDILSKTKIKVLEPDNPERCPETGAMMFLSRRQISDLACLAIAGDYSRKEVIETLNEGNGVEIALFGRMVAEEPSLCTDACCQVAHSISTHGIRKESDFFTAVDQSPHNDANVAGMLGNLDFTSSTQYRYATVSFHDLCKSLGDREAASRATVAFADAFIRAIPAGHISSFATYCMPYSVYVAVRSDQPSCLAGAFEKPVKVQMGDGGYNQESVRRMVGYERQLESVFNTKPEVSWQIGQGLDELGPASDMATSMQSLGKYLLSEVRA